MENPDKFFSSIYDDFFSIIAKNPEDIDKETAKEKFLNAKLDSDLLKKNEENISIIIDPNKQKEKEEESQKSTDEIIDAEKKALEALKEGVKELSAEAKKQKLQEFYDRIDELLLNDESKVLLRKMVTYAYKFNSNLTKTYIGFNIKLYGNNDDSINNIINLITDCFQYYNYVKQNGIVSSRSLYDIESSADIANLFTNTNSIVILKNVSGLLNKDAQTKDKMLNTLETCVQSKNVPGGIISIIVNDDKVEVDNLFANSPTLNNSIYSYELFTIEETIQDVYQGILSTLKENYIINDQFEVTLLDYITETYELSVVPSDEYRENLINTILLNQTTDIIDQICIPEFSRAKSIDEIFKELDSLVGLENVKESLHELVNLMEFKKKTNEKVNISDTNLHMVFLGNPGTGKTTVARMIAGILYNLKYIDNNKLIEVSAKDLIGQYVGQTAPKTMEVVSRALGGVLFIDEAYSLASTSTGNNSFNEECIATLIQAMENYRDNLVVIFAGYSKEMDVFLKSNSGIVSRIGYTFEFKDYTEDQLITILKSMFKKAGFSVEKEALDKARSIIEEYRNTQGFGNARFVRNLYEKAIIKHASNTHDVTSIRVLKKITQDDITSDNLIKM